MTKYLFTAIYLLFALASCQNAQNNTGQPLPIYGNSYVSEAGDTVYHTIPDFSFTNQDGKTVTNKSLRGKIYVADFFFASCPGICPIVTSNIKRIQDEFKGEEMLMIAAFTLDPENEDLEILKEYATSHDIDTKNCHFLRGDQAETMELARKHLDSAELDKDAPGGINHGGRLALVDSQGRIRSYCQGTNAEDVDRMMEDIRTLLAEEKANLQTASH